MPVFGPFESRIVVNKHALPEYEEKEETDGTGLKMITCWIPSEVDQEFAIRLRDNRMLGRPATRWRTTVDGVVLGSKPIFSDTGPFSSTRNERHRKDIPTDKGRRKIRFSELKLTDDDELLHMTGNATLGEMRIRITPVKVDGPLPQRCDRVVTLGGDTVHERSKKAGAHHVQLGAMSKHVDGPGYRTSPTGPPIVEFVFRYRPIDLLRANGIAPQVAQPTPTGHAHSSEIPTEVDPEAVKNERIRRLEEELLHLRGEGSASGTVIKTEAGRCSLTKLASGSDDIIDLTLDD